MTIEEMYEKASECNDAAKAYSTEATQSAEKPMPEDVGQALTRLVGILGTNLKMQSQLTRRDMWMIAADQAGQLKNLGKAVTGIVEVIQVAAKLRPQ